MYIDKSLIMGWLAGDLIYTAIYPTADSFLSTYTIVTFLITVYFVNKLLNNKQGEQKNGI